MTTDLHDAGRTDCDCCGPNALTVAEALWTTADPELEATLGHLAFRPMHDPVGRRAVLVDVATNAPVAAWDPHEARAMADEVAHGPYRATLCLDTCLGVLRFERDELVALAAALSEIAGRLQGSSGAQDGTDSSDWT